MCVHIYSGLKVSRQALVILGQALLIFQNLSSYWEPFKYSVNMMNLHLVDFLRSFLRTNIDLKKHFAKHGSKNVYKYTRLCMYANNHKTIYVWK